MKIRFYGFTLAVILLVAFAPTRFRVFAADMFSGTWKQNLEKSTYSPGPAPKESITQKITVVGDKITIGGANGGGFTVSFDGKDHPYKLNGGQAPAANATLPEVVSAKKINDYTFEITFKTGGKVTQVNRNAISKDGKTRTITRIGTNAQGRAVKNVLIFEKQ